jgi:hypothetical protein
MDPRQTNSDSLRGDAGAPKAPGTSWSLLLDMAGDILPHPTAMRSASSRGPTESLEQHGITSAPDAAAFLNLAAAQSKLVYDNCGTLGSDHEHFKMAFPAVTNPKADGTVVAEIESALRDGATLSGTADNKVMVCRYSNIESNGWPKADEGYSRRWLCAAAQLAHDQVGGPKPTDILTTLTTSGLTDRFAIHATELHKWRAVLPIGHRNLMTRPFGDGLVLSGYTNNPNRGGGSFSTLQLALTFAKPTENGLLWLWAQETIGIIGI